jgi:hypothetical protein
MLQCLAGNLQAFLEYTAEDKLLDTLSSTCFYEVYDGLFVVFASTAARSRVLCGFDCLVRSRSIGLDFSRRMHRSDARTKFTSIDRRIL